MAFHKKPGQLKFTSMRILNKTNFYGNWRSVKVFMPSGNVKYSDANLFLEFEFNTERVFTIKNCADGLVDIIANEESWGLVIKRGKYYLRIPPLELSYEVITIDHNVMVLLDTSSQDKLFFAEVSAWRSYLQPKPIIKMWN